MVETNVEELNREIRIHMNSFLLGKEYDKSVGRCKKLESLLDRISEDIKYADSIRCANNEDFYELIGSIGTILQERDLGVE